MGVMFGGISLITHNMPAIADVYTRLLGIDAEGADIHVELNTEGQTCLFFQ